MTKKRIQKIKIKTAEMRSKAEWTLKVNNISIENIYNKTALLLEKQRKTIKEEVTDVS